MKNCVFIRCEICTNEECPMYDEYCPVAGEFYEMCTYYEADENED